MNCRTDTSVSTKKISGTDGANYAVAARQPTAQQHTLSAESMFLAKI